MTDQTVQIQPLTPAAFKPFGEVIATETVTPKLINNDQNRRYSDLAKLDIIEGHSGLSLFHATLRTLPYKLIMMERHTLGSQCFNPMDQSHYIVIVAEDVCGVLQAPACLPSSTALARGRTLRNIISKTVSSPSRQINVNFQSPVILVLH